jgi:hypothetical protein
MTRAFLLLAFPVALQAQRLISLAKPDAEHADPFSQISGVRELRDGRVIVSDPKDKLVQVLDMKGGTTRVSREGSGPGEYLLPNAMVALPNDSTAIWDGGNRRYLLLGPDAKPVREFRLEPPEGLGNRGYGAFSATFPRGVDAKGNIYFLGSPFITNPDGAMAVADTVPVMRFNRARQIPETVAYVFPAEGTARVKPGPGGRGLNISNGLGNPLVPLDSWTALPDGRVAVVRGKSYRMDLYTDGKAVVGAATPYDRIKVDAAMKKFLEDERLKGFAGGAPRTGRPGAAAPPDISPAIRDELMKDMLNMEPWPEYTPPFRMNAAIGRATPAGGQVWVLLTKRAESDSTRYDVFDASAKLVARVTLAPKSRVIAFGNGTVYAFRADDDDLQYLQRYRLSGL